MKLSNVYEYPDHLNILFGLLSERTPDQSISHKNMPSMKEHIDFVQSHPYEAWYIIDDGFAAGSVYLTKNNEIGIFVFTECQGLGYGKWAIQEIMRLHPKPRYLANVNPKNTLSANLFGRIGFKIIQETYEWRL